MKELEKHRMAFEMYYETRNVTAIGKRFGVSDRSVHKWKRLFDWKEKCIIRDQEVAKGVKEKLLPEWIDMKAYLLKTLIEQVKKARDAGIEPQSTRDIVAAIKEIRSMMGESDKVEVTGTVNMTLTETLEEYENVLKRIAASDPAENDS